VLNERFRRGVPSNRLREAGVVLRVFDGMENPAAPWRAPEADKQGYAPPSWRGTSAQEFLPASIVNARRPEIYQDIWAAPVWKYRMHPEAALPGFAGLIFDSSEAVERRIKCSAGRDFASVGVPGGCRYDKDVFPAGHLKEALLAQERNSNTIAKVRGTNRIDQTVSMLGHNENDIVTTESPDHDSLESSILAIWTRSSNTCGRLSRDFPDTIHVVCGMRDHDVSFARHLQHLVNTNATRARRPVPILVYNVSSATHPFTPLCDACVGTPTSSPAYMPTYSMPCLNHDCRS